MTVSPNRSCSSVAIFSSGTPTCLCNRTVNVTAPGPSCTPAAPKASEVCSGCRLPFLLAVCSRFFLGRLGVQDIVFFGQPALENDELLFRQLALLNLANQIIELVDASIKGTQQCVG